MANDEEMTASSFSESDDESPRMKKPKDLAADEDREWEIFRKATERLKEPKLDDS